MATYIFRLSSNEIIGARVAIDGATAPNDSVIVTEQAYDDYESLKAQMRSDGRRDAPHYIDSAVVIPDDTRAVITVSIAESDIKLDQFANITINLTNSPNYSGDQYLHAFDEIFKFTFSSGEAVRTDILFPHTGIFKFKSNGTLKVSNPFNVRVYR